MAGLTRATTPVHYRPATAVAVAATAAALAGAVILGERREICARRSARLRPDGPAARVPKASPARAEPPCRMPPPARIVGLEARRCMAMLMVGAVMNEGTVAIGERAAVPEIVDVVERCRTRTVAVVDAFGRLLGVIDPVDHPDLFPSFAAHGPRVVGSRRQRDHRGRSGHCTARELMSPFPVLKDTCPVDEAVRSLDDLDADIAVVVDDLGCVVGTVTRLVCRAVLSLFVFRPVAGGVDGSTAASGAPWAGPLSASDAARLAPTP
jgi:hypothetical protein